MERGLVAAAFWNETDWWNWALQNPLRGGSRRCVNNGAAVLRLLLGQNVAAAVGLLIRLFARWSAQWRAKRYVPSFGKLTAVSTSRGAARRSAVNFSCGGLPLSCGISNWIRIVCYSQQLKVYCALPSYCQGRRLRISQPVWLWVRCCFCTGARKLIFSAHKKIELVYYSKENIVLLQLQLQIWESTKGATFLN